MYINIIVTNQYKIVCIMYIAVVYNLYGLLPPNEYSRTNTFTVFFAYLPEMYRQPSTNI